MIKKAFSIFYKDWQSELRTRYAVNSLAMFILVTVSVFVFALGEEKVSPQLIAGLFWIGAFFSAMSGLSRIFVTEEERGTTLFLKLVASPSTVYLGKLLFNLILSIGINLFITLLFFFFFDSFIIQQVLLFFAMFLLGSAGIAISSTTIAAIISRASSKGNLFAVLAFPILLPLILILLEITKVCIKGNGLSDGMVELGMLVSYDVIMFTIGLMLFDFIWKD
ncbi:MAG: heme exporter protein CcmB [Rhodothermaceae bacterium]